MSVISKEDAEPNNNKSNSQMEAVFYGFLQLAKKASWRGLHFNWTRQQKNGIYLCYPKAEDLKNVFLRWNIIN